MASTNQSPQYQKAEARFLSAIKDEDRLFYLEEMIRECPKHKSAEKMLAQLRIRRKKLMEKMERNRKVGKGRSGKKGIKKEDMQAVIVGFSNSGKSTLLSLLTNTSPSIGLQRFTTKEPLVGMMPYSGIGVQIIEIPPVESEYFDKSVTNNADTILILVNEFGQIRELIDMVQRAKGRKIIVFNDFHNLDENEKRKVSSRLQSQKHDFVLISTLGKYGIDALREKIFKSFGKIRVFTKEPKKEKSGKPVILDENSAVRDVAEKILHGFSEKVREARIWGPSSKFSGQVVGLSHKLKDMDIVEFKTR